MARDDYDRDKTNHLSLAHVLNWVGACRAQREGKPTNKEEEPVPLSDDVLAAIASLKKVALQMGESRNTEHTWSTCGHEHVRHGLQYLVLHVLVSSWWWPSLSQPLDHRLCAVVISVLAATTLREADCPMISITGDTHVFSCQELGPYVSHHTRHT